MIRSWGVSVLLWYADVIAGDRFRPQTPSVRHFRLCLRGVSRARASLHRGGVKETDQLSKNINLHTTLIPPLRGVIVRR